MRIIAKTANSDIATVYLAETAGGNLIEFVESVQPPIPKKDKWVIIVSTLCGCPVNCSICDAGGNYTGKLDSEQILAQIRYLVDRDFPSGEIGIKKFKIQFARMGEPALNRDVIQVLTELHRLYRAPGLIPSISTVAPRGCDLFFKELAQVKQDHYAKGRFQLQFSIHTTDRDLRDQIIPIKKWDYAEIARYGEAFFKPGDRKISLNFAVTEGFPIEAKTLLKYFSPDLFLIKLTPLNPTVNALKNNLTNCLFDGMGEEGSIRIQSLRSRGYEVIVSIGEMEENKIGSNCGQYIKKYLDTELKAQDNFYTYSLER
jgi:23S rRNA (adenine2503-C2)-methyltransferase